MALRAVLFRAVMLGVALSVTISCSKTPPRLNPPSIDASAAGDAAIKQYDANADGKISGEELDKSPSLKHAISRIDRNSDGAIDAGEITGRIKQWQESKLGRVSICCTIKRGGEPVAGAAVKFVPEKFLGDKIQVGQGTSNESGVANITVPISGDDPPGVAPGFYSIEVTKSGEEIPAKYNTQTTLGMEIALDAPEMMGQEIVFAVD
jgi:hypothetical protein